jgi:signal transduction histidine kinase
MPAAPFETVRRRRDGTTVDVALTLSPVCDRNGTVIGLSSVTRDITARKQLEAELRTALEEARAANAAKSQFLAMMSHELRTPLQAVLGYSEFLLADPAGTFTAEQREDLTYIQQGGQRMLTLINQLLDLSRLEAGRLDVAHKPVDLAPIVEQVRQDVAPQVNKQGLVLRIALPTNLPPVDGDAERLRQILLNLVGNAVKFTEHGSVTIGAVATEDEVSVTVTDTGIGIAPDSLPQLFEAFRQVDSRLVRRHGGAGLGLAIAQKLAELMGGQITVHSELGVGSTFTLSVPVAAPTQDGFVRSARDDWSGSRPGLINSA